MPEEMDNNHGTLSVQPYRIVIPTFKRCNLLERTIVSLSRSILPSGLEAVIVAENGQQLGAKAVVTKHAQKLPLQYRFTAKPNKSHALNSILGSLKNEFVIFFDDDIRVHPHTLISYVEALKKYGKGNFFAGRCLVDYEEEPPEWLKSYLPPSAKGWDLGDVKLRLSAPDALGANWGAFATDLKAAGGFDEHRGPGTAARGQETFMQGKLMANGLAVYYLPDALVWHFVPKDRCSPEWCLERGHQIGVRDGMNLLQAAKLERIRRAFRASWKSIAIRSLLAICNGRLNETRSFHYSYRLRRHQGLLKGLATSRRQ
jgi:glycosyltransferase involved in cell wall biosynthesis